MSKIEAIHAVILTYNRKDLLRRCIEVLNAQTRPLDGIIIVDNGSTDGTREMLVVEGILADPKVDYVQIRENIGPAAGFNHAMQYAFSRRHPWLWLMDDDVIPDPNALEVLVGAYERNFKKPTDIGFLVARAVDPHGRANNVPAIDERPVGNGCAEWGDLLAQGMIRIRTSAFTGFLVPHETLTRFGVIEADMRMWGDDSAYTLGISEKVPCYLVGGARVVHERAVPGDIIIFNETSAARLPNYYYLYRNTAWLRRRFFSKHAYVLWIVKGLLHTVKCLKSDHQPLKRAWIVLTGTLAGITYKPRRAKPPTAIQMDMMIRNEELRRSGL